MKKILIILLLQCLILYGFSQDIRKNKWGDSMEKVKEMEGNVEFNHGNVKNSVSNTFIYFEGKVNDLNATIAFFFTNNKLYRVNYVFTEKHANEELYVNDFYGIKNKLDEKYGKINTEMIWQRDLYKENLDKWGFAISIGHLVMYTQRSNDKTTIEHYITGDNYEIKHNLAYTSKDLFDLAKENRVKVDDF